MQYLVETVGDVLERKAKAYVVEAESKEDAEVLARNQFDVEYYSTDTTVYVKPRERTKPAIVACVLMTIPIVLSLLTWTSGHARINISPDAISCLFAVLLYTAFVVRVKGIHRTLATKEDIVLTIVSVLLLSTFIRSIFVCKSFKFLFKSFTIDTTILLVFIVVLSWLGLKLASTVCIGIVCVTAFTNIVKLSQAMGVWGVVYVLLAFLGILFYLSIEPAVLESIPQYKYRLSKRMDRIKQDAIDTGDKVKKLSVKG